MEKKYKLLILETHPIPYRTPLFEELSKNKKILLKVLFCSDFSLKEKEHEDFGKVKLLKKLKGFDYELLKNNYPFKERPPPKGLWNLEIIKKLIKEKPDAILIYGYQSFTHKIAFISSKIIGIPIIFRDEIDFIDSNSPFIKKIKNNALKFLFKNPKAFLYSYTRSKKYYLSLKIPSKKLFFHPCAVNNRLLQKQAKKDWNKKEKIKKKLGFSKNSKLILYIGRLNKRKRVFDIVKAYSKLEDKNTYLIFVGGGNETKIIKKFSKENKLRKIRIIPFREGNSLYNYYSIADIFVLTSEYDPSPKVLNEAMNFSLPIIISDKVGTAKDLVKDKKNGYIFQCGNIKDLSEKMNKLIKNSKLRKKMGKESLKIVSKWNFKSDVNGTIKALDYIYRKNEKIKRKD